MANTMFDKLTLKQKRTIVVSGILIFLALGAVSFVVAQANKQDVAALNQSLPQGITIVKNVFGEYQVINHKDGYSFKIPKEWKGIESIEYIPERAEGPYVARSISIYGNTGSPRYLNIDQFQQKEPNKTLLIWAEENFNYFNLVGNFKKDNIGKREIVKTTEEKHLMGMSVYFFSTDTKTYALTNGSEEYLKYIITNGKW